MPTPDRRALLAGAACLLFGPIAARASEATPAGFRGRIFLTDRAGVRVHTYVAEPAGGMVTSHVVETGAGPVLIDGQLLPAAARELKTYLDGLGRPLARTFLSHAHPDHWFGFHHLGRPAVHAGPLTARFVAERAAAVVAERNADSSAPVVAGTVGEGEETIGGVLFRFRRVLDTEAPEMLTIELPAAGVFVAQDLVYNRVHAVVSRQIDQWVAALRAIEARSNATTVVLPGHGEPATPADLPRLVAYLEAVKPLIEAHIGRESEAAAITAEIARAFPDYRLPPLLTLGLNRSLPR